MISPTIPATTVTDGGCSIMMGNGTSPATNTSFGAASAPPGTTATFNNARGFTGKITFTGSNAPCTSPPTAGTATVSPLSGICMGTNLALNLTGNSIGVG